MQRNTSTSLWGVPTEVPSWVKELQSDVFLSGFGNDLLNKIDTFSSQPTIGYEGQVYWNKVLRQLYLYSDNQWHQVGRTYNRSEHGGSENLFLSASHTNGDFKSLTKDHSGVIDEDTTFQLLPGQSGILEVSLVVQEQVPTAPENTQTCKFHFHVSRNLDGVVIQSNSPLLFYFSEPGPKFRISATELGLIDIQVSASDATDHSPYISIAQCDLVVLG